MIPREASKLEKSIKKKLGVPSNPCSYYYYYYYSLRSIHGGGSETLRATVLWPTKTLGRSSHSTVDCANIWPHVDITNL